MKIQNFYLVSSDIFYPGIKDATAAAGTNVDTGSCASILTAKFGKGK